MKKKFRGHFFSPLRTVGNPKSFLERKKKRKSWLYFIIYGYYCKTKTSTMKKKNIICMYMGSEEECLNKYFLEWLRWLFSCLIWCQLSCFILVDYNYFTICVGFCYTSTRISHRYIYVSSPLESPSHLPPLSYHPSRFSQSTRFGFLPSYHLNMLHLLWCHSFLWRLKYQLIDR